MQNPLLCNKTTITAIDQYTNEEIVVSIVDIGKYFRKVYCLCPFTTIDYNILSKNILEEGEYNELIDRMIIYATDIKIVKNMVHYGNLIYCEKKYIEKANRFNYELNEMVLILPFFNISFLNLQKYIDNINGAVCLDNLYNMLIMSNYFGDNEKKMVNYLHTSNMIKTLNSSDYWKIYENCRCNLTKMWNNRNFNFSILK